MWNLIISVYLPSEDRPLELIICIFLVGLVLPAHLFMCYRQHIAVPKVLTGVCSSSNAGPKLIYLYFFKLTSPAEKANVHALFFHLSFELF